VLHSTDRLLVQHIQKQLEEDRSGKPVIGMDCAWLVS
jgi:hypothetical protein